MHRVELKATFPLSKLSHSSTLFLMHRVELKALFPLNAYTLPSVFLMHRVELKDSAVALPSS